LIHASRPKQRILIAELIPAPAHSRFGSRARISFTLRLRLLDPQHQTSSGHGAMVCEGPDSAMAGAAIRALRFVRSLVACGRSESVGNSCARPRLSRCHVDIKRTAEAFFTAYAYFDRSHLPILHGRDRKWPPLLPAS